MSVYREQAPTLRTRGIIGIYDMTHADEVMRPVAGDKCCTFNARMGTGGNQIPVVAYGIGTGQTNQSRMTEKANALTAAHEQQGILCAGHARRLTPLECERLQGLLDGYTLIDDKSCSDTARYKALGNGMAQPCADWVIKRIKEVAT